MSLSTSPRPARTDAPPADDDRRPGPPRPGWSAPAAWPWRPAARRLGRRHRWPYDLDPVDRRAAHWVYKAELAAVPAGSGRAGDVQLRTRATGTGTAGPRLPARRARAAGPGDRVVAPRGCSPRELTENAVVPRAGRLLAAVDARHGGDRHPDRHRRPVAGGRADLAGDRRELGAGHVPRDRPSPARRSTTFVARRAPARRLHGARRDPGRPAGADRRPRLTPPDGAPPPPGRRGAVVRCGETER